MIRATFATSTDLEATGQAMYRLVETLYPISRSITGPGVRQTLAILGEHLPLEVHEVPTGTQVFDWQVPREWHIRDAYVKDRRGRRVIDFRRSNLHVVGYSVPVRARMSLEALRPHLHTLPDRPDWIPYRTSYYEENWGFCLSHHELLGLQEGEYEVAIDASLEDGSLTYGELYLPGRSTDEVLFSCHLCHPSLANDNLAGIAVATYLAKHVAGLDRRYSYRFLFIPGTIGAITWLALNQENARRIKHGLVLALLGDPGKLTYKKSRRGDAQIDRAAACVLRHSGREHAVVEFDPYGYDERQFCSPGFNLPVGRLTRTPHGRYPEYHTSADDLALVRPRFLADSYSVCVDLIDLLEHNRTYRNRCPHGEPQLGRRGLYGEKKGTGPSCRDGPEGTSHKFSSSKFWLPRPRPACLAGGSVWQANGEPQETAYPTSPGRRRDGGVGKWGTLGGIAASLSNLFTSRTRRLGSLDLRDGSSNLELLKLDLSPFSHQQAMLWVLNLSDESHSLLDIAERSQLPFSAVKRAAQLLSDHHLLEETGGEPEVAIAPKRHCSQALHRKAHALIPGGCHTYAKGDDQYPVTAPPFIVRGRGCRVEDAEGKEYIEYGSGLRSVTLGHAYPPVVEAAYREMLQGINFVRPSTIEVECAERLLELVEAAEMVKFAKNGSDVTTAAVKLARAYTGRDLVAVCEDHPFFSVDDWFIGTTQLDAGIPQAIPQMTVKFRYNDPQSVQALFDRHPGCIACLIMEAATHQEPENGFLEKVQKLCHDHGAVFILDEIVTGFRWALGGAQKAYGITPDLSTFGKGMANGFSLAALVGKREIMRLGGLDHDGRRVFLLSTTNGAETHCLRAAMETMRIYRTEPVVERLYEQGRRLREGIDQVVRDKGLDGYFAVAGRPSNMIYVTRDQNQEQSQAFRTLFLQETIQRGVIAPSFVVSYSHSDADIDQTIEVVAESLEVYRRALEDGIDKYLVGRPTKPVNRRFN